MWNSDFLIFWNCWEQGTSVNMFTFSAFEELLAMAPAQEATITTVAIVATIAIEATDSNCMPADKKENPKNQEEEKLVKNENPKDHEQETLQLNGDGHVNFKVQALVSCGSHSQEYFDFDLNEWHAFQWQIWDFEAFLWAQ